MFYRDMVPSQNKGHPNIDPKILQSLLWGPQNGTPNFRETPYIGNGKDWPDPQKDPKIGSLEDYRELYSNYIGVIMALYRGSNF